MSSLGDSFDTHAQTDEEYFAKREAHRRAREQARKEREERLQKEREATLANTLKTIAILEKSAFSIPLLTRLVYCARSFDCLLLHMTHFS